MLAGFARPDHRFRNLVAVASREEVTHDVGRFMMARSQLSLGRYVSLSLSLSLRVLSIHNSHALLTAQLSLAPQYHLLPFSFIDCVCVCVSPHITIYFRSVLLTVCVCVCVCVCVGGLSLEVTCVCVCSAKPCSLPC